MNEITFAPSKPQSKLFDYFDDKETTEIIFGSGVGCGKSFAISALMVMKCLQYPEIRIVLARNELTVVKRTTVVSLFEVLNNWNLQSDEHYTYNSTSGEITFYNKSKIILVEMTYRPSDPQFTRFGGLLATFAVVDECSEVSLQAKQILQSRVGRWKNKDYGIKPLFIGTCNPSRGWLYNEFYKPFIEDKLDSHKKFIPALITDNKYNSEDYYKNLLKTLSQSDKERLLFGNWDYSMDPTNLLTFEEILSTFINKKAESFKQTYISADIAFTSDKCVICCWQDLQLVETFVMEKNGKPENEIKRLQLKYKVKNTNICFDSDGIGKYLTNYLPNAKPIINNAKALNNENYANIKTQMYFELAKQIKEGKLTILNGPYDEQIKEELALIRHKPSDNVGKIEMVSKGDIKRILGHSPDFSDAISYRLIFELKPKGETTIISFNF